MNTNIRTAFDTIQEKAAKENQSSMELIASVRQQFAEASHIQSNARTFCSIAAGPLWMLIFGWLFFVLQDDIPLHNPQFPTLLVPSMWVCMILAALVSVNQILRSRYHVKINRFLARCTKRRDQLDKFTKDFPFYSEQLLSAQNNRWDFALTVVPSVHEEMTQDQKSVKALKVFQGTLLKYVMTALFYTACFLCAFCACQTIYVGCFDDSSKVILVLHWIVLIVACCAQFFAARYMLARTDFHVTGLTLIAVFSGAAVYGIIALILYVIAVMVVGIGYLIVGILMVCLPFAFLGSSISGD